MRAPPEPAYPLLQSHRGQGWAAAAGAHIGLGREHMEDAFEVLLERPVGPTRVTAAAVFDGVGGLPLGSQAATAAARALGPALAGSPRELLDTLNRAARGTGGLTTAVVAVAREDGPPGEVHLAWVGDSSAWALDAAGRARLLVPPHADSAGLTDWLGRAGPAGEVVAWRLAPGASILLCTDGVDRVVAPAAIAAALRAPPPELRGAVERLLREVLDAGAPDNAAAVLLHRVADPAPGRRGGAARKRVTGGRAAGSSPRR